MNCPACQRPVYSRQHQTCGYCGAELPPSMWLKEHEVDEMKEEMKAIDKRRAADREKEAKLVEERRRRDHGHGTGFGPSSGW